MDWNELNFVQLHYTLPKNMMSSCVMLIKADHELTLHGKHAAYACSLLRQLIDEDHYAPSPCCCIM